MLKVLFLLPLLIYTTTACGQNQCDELRQEREQLMRRLKELDSQLHRCGEKSSASGCTEQVQSGQGIEIKTTCAEVKGNVLKIHFSVRNTDDSNPKQSIYLTANTNAAYDQKGKKYNSHLLKFNNQQIQSDLAYFDLVYNIWYDGYLEFHIGSEFLNEVRLLEMDGNGITVNFEHIEVKQQ